MHNVHIMVVGLWLMSLSFLSIYKHFSKIKMYFSFHGKKKKRKKFCSNKKAKKSLTVYGLYP